MTMWLVATSRPTRYLTRDRSNPGLCLDVPVMCQPQVCYHRRPHWTGGSYT